MAFADTTIAAFLDATASRKPTPGGGSVAALGAALGAALVAKTCAVSLGRADLAQHHPALQRALDEAGRLRRECEALMDEDADAYDDVAAAYRLPRSTEQDRAARALSIQYALRGASAVPLRLAERCAAIAQLARRVAPLVVPSVASDGAVGAQLAVAAQEGAAETLEANLGAIRDEAFVIDARARLHDAQNDASAALTEVLRAVHRRAQE